MTPTRDALAWGLVGGLAYLVLLLGYELASGRRVGPLATVGVALLVAAAATVGAAALAARRRANGSA